MVKLSSFVVKKWPDLVVGVTRPKGPVSVIPQASLKTACGAFSKYFLARASPNGAAATRTSRIDFKWSGVTWGRLARKETTGGAMWRKVGL